MILLHSLGEYVEIDVVIARSIRNTDTTTEIDPLEADSYFPMDQGSEFEEDFRILYEFLWISLIRDEHRMESEPLHSEVVELSICFDNLILSHPVFCL